MADTRILDSLIIMTMKGSRLSRKREGDVRKKERARDSGRGVRGRRERRGERGEREIVLY